MKLFSISRFVFGLLSQAIVTGSIQFLSPNLSLHLRTFGYEPEFISLAFCIPSLIYACITPFICLITARFSKRLVIISGITLLGIANFFIGTSELFGAQNDSDMILLGLCLVGVAASTITIPVLPEMLESVEQNEDCDYEQEEIENVISGLFITSTGLGETIGPILSSVLVELYDFRTS
jgi:MFS family permease